MTPKTTTNAIVPDMTAYLNKYMTFPNPDYATTLTLWTLATHMWPSFDAFPYLTITSATKRSGKTRLSELLSFTAANAVNTAAMTAAAMFRTIAQDSPTLIVDEAEELSSEAADMMRTVINVGYRRGQTIKRVGPKGIEDFPVYCPKVFILIGDTFDTLRDRSIVITMMRGNAPCRFVYDVASAEGNELRDRAADLISENAGKVMEVYRTHTGLPFLPDRDEEIWLPLFSVCQVLAPDMVEELKRIAVDLATEKTAEARNYITLKGAEIDAANDEYADMLLRDLRALLKGRDFILTSDALPALKEIPTSPWRKFRGEGLTAIDMANLLSRFGVHPKQKKIGGRNGRVQRGYARDQVSKAMREHLGAHE
jgi:hypothetical protein